MTDWTAGFRRVRWEVRQVFSASEDGGTHWWYGNIHQADGEESGKALLHRLADAATEDRWELVRVVNEENITLVRDRRRPMDE